ncbi:MAG: TorF family putative porin [Gammaproteobacteria bacterium]
MNSALQKLAFSLLAYSVSYSALGAEFSGSLRFTTNYTSRGYSKSNGGPAIQGNLDYEHETGFFAGTWVSSIDFNDEGFADRSNAEIAPYIGWHLALSDDWQADAFIARYFYDGKLFGQYSDYNELNALINFRDLASLRIGWSEDLYHRGHAAPDYELTLRYPFTDTLEASAGVGFSDTLQALHYRYLYWNAGISWFFSFGSMDLRYVQASQSGHSATLQQVHFEPKVLDSNAVFSLSIGF